MGGMRNAESRTYSTSHAETGRRPRWRSYSQMTQMSPEEPDARKRAHPVRGGSVEKCQATLEYTQLEDAGNSPHSYPTEPRRSLQIDSVALDPPLRPSWPIRAPFGTKNRRSYEVAEPVTKRAFEVPWGHFLLYYSFAIITHRYQSFSIVSGWLSSSPVLRI